MTEQAISNSTLANSSSTAENKEMTIKEPKEIVSRMQIRSGRKPSEKLFGGTGFDKYQSQTRKII